MGDLEDPAVTPSCEGHISTRKRLAGKGFIPLRLYRDMVVGQGEGWLGLLLYEATTGILGPLPGGLGYFLRQWIYPAIFGAYGKGTLLGRNITVRHSRRIGLGRGVAIDENVLLDARDGSITIGDDTLIGRGSAVATRGGLISMGQNCSVGTGCRLATFKTIVIEDDVLIAANCYIGGGNHRSERLDVPISAQGMCEQNGVRIGQGAWLGANAIIMDGTCVGHDAIIGAAALVTEDIPAWAVAVGQPARVIRLRTDGAHADGRVTE